jgi:hypothetical protein
MWKHVLKILTANSETPIIHHMDQLKGLKGGGGGANK